MPDRVETASVVEPIAVDIQRNRVLGIAIAVMASVLWTANAGADVSEKIADRLAGAMKFETVSYENPADFDGAPFDALEAYLRSLYPRAHSTLQLEKINDYTLLFEWPGSNELLAPGLFMSHLDVVPVEPAAAEKWTHPPYGGVIEEGYAWGRGALDVKIGVILWLEAVEALLEEGFEPERTLYLSFGHDEEIGGKFGAKVVAERFKEEGVRLAYLFDEGGMLLEGHPLLPETVVANIVTAEKTFYTVELTARGVSGHSSMPPPSTAIGKLSRAIHAVEMNPMPARISKPLREMLETASPHLSPGMRFATGNLWLTGWLLKRGMQTSDLNSALLRTTFATTLISGGVKSNVLPEIAEATINVRILPGDTPEQVLEHLERVIDDPEIEIKGISWGEAAPAASVEGPAFRFAAEAVAAVLPDAVILPGLVPGGTDSRHFAGVSEEILRFVPMRVSTDLVGGAHGRDERIEVEHLANSRAIAIGMIRRGATAPAAD